jgi:hypothetical protein
MTATRYLTRICCDYAVNNLPCTSYTVTTWASEQPRMSFYADNAYQAYDLVLMKAIYRSMQVTVIDARGNEISLHEIARMAGRLRE